MIWSLCQIYSMNLMENILLRGISCDSSQNYWFQIFDVAPNINSLRSAARAAFLSTEHGYYSINCSKNQNSVSCKGYSWSRRNPHCSSSPDIELNIYCPARVLQRSPISKSLIIIPFVLWDFNVCLLQFILRYGREYFYDISSQPKPFLARAWIGLWLICCRMLRWAFG